MAGSLQKRDRLYREILFRYRWPHVLRGDENRNSRTKTPICIFRNVCRNCHGSIFDRFGRQELRRKGGQAVQPNSLLQKHAGRIRAQIQRRIRSKRTFLLHDPDRHRRPHPRSDRRSCADTPDRRIDSRTAPRLHEAGI